MINGLLPFFFPWSLGAASCGRAGALLGKQKWSLLINERELGAIAPERLALPLLFARPLSGFSRSLGFLSFFRR